MNTIQNNALTTTERICVHFLISFVICKRLWTDVNVGNANEETVVESS